MSVISGNLASAITQAVVRHAPAAQALTTSSGSGTSAFGPATSVTLSAAAQQSVGASSSGSGTASAGTGGGGGGGGGGLVISAPATTTDSTLLIEIAEDQVAPKVGVADASLVVDKNGNIDLAKLNELVNQQAAAATAKTG